METLAIPTNQSEPEEVQRLWIPLPFQLITANQRRSQRL